MQRELAALLHYPTYLRDEHAQAIVARRVEAAATLSERCCRTHGEARQVEGLRRLAEREIGALDDRTAFDVKRAALLHVFLAVAEGAIGEQSQEAGAPQYEAAVDQRAL